MRRPPPPPASRPAPEPGCVRCPCGALIARLVDGGVELKCRRCKRTHWVPLVEAGPDPLPG